MTMERLRFSHLLANKSVIGVRNKPFFEEIDEFLTEKKDASFLILLKELERNAYLCGSTNHLSSEVVGYLLHNVWNRFRLTL